MKKYNHSLVSVNCAGNYFLCLNKKTQKYYLADQSFNPIKNLELRREKDSIALLSPNGEKIAVQDAQGITVYEVEQCSTPLYHLDTTTAYSIAFIDNQSLLLIQNKNCAIYTFFKIDLLKREISPFFDLETGILEQYSYSKDCVVFAYENRQNCKHMILEISYDGTVLQTICLDHISRGAYLQSVHFNESCDKFLFVQGRSLLKSPKLCICDMDKQTKEKIVTLPRKMRSLYSLIFNFDWLDKSHFYVKYETRAEIYCVDSAQPIFTYETKSRDMFPVLFYNEKIYFSDDNAIYEFDWNE